MRHFAVGLIIAVLIAVWAEGTALAAPSKLEPLLLPLPVPPGPAVQPYIKVNAPRIALMHVRVIDGTGEPARDDQSIIIEGRRIAAIGPAGTALLQGAQQIDLTGHTVFPGLVGMHDHMYYIARPNLGTPGGSEPPLLLPQMTFSAPRLYLANGVTTLRTSGSVEPYADINLKHMIDSGTVPGPHMDVTGPYLEGAGSFFIQMHQLKDAQDAKETVAFWARQGATSFKAYMNITRAELKAVVEEAHRLGLKVTGHLCAVTYREAAAIGIDNLEHGFFANTELDPDKRPDTCPATAGRPTLFAMDHNGDAANALIEDLVAHRVAVTSTLPVFEQFVPGHAPLSSRALEALAPQAREAFLSERNRTNSEPAEQSQETILFRRDLALERKFATAGGLLLAGPDPTGNGGVVPGFGDLRGVELLVEAGFTPEEAVKVASYNGARYLGLEDRIGSVAPGKNADLVVVKGDPSRAITDIENVEIVFKDGVGYDSAAVLNSVRGRYGEY